MLFNEDRRRNRDRRAAPRTPALGPIKLAFENPAPIAIEAELIETSATGFRASHGSNSLEPGLEVRFDSNQSHGRARVIWTHVIEGRRVSGFIIL